MRVAVTMSWIAIGGGVAFGISDPANATDEGEYQNSSAIEPKIKSDARIMGSDGRARTPTQGTNEVRSRIGVLGFACSH
jgi:hypothetical protein